MDKKVQGAHDGHRARLIRKMEQGNVCEHEYLEALLFNAVPRRNTNDLAHKLLAELGSVYNIFTAPIERLMRVEGIGKSVASYLYCIGKMIEEYEKTDGLRLRCPLTYNEENFRFYLKQEYESVPYEVMDVFMLNKNNELFMRKRFSVKSDKSVLLLPEELSKSIVTEEATGIIVVHNHPSGSSKPSEADDKATKKIQMICVLNNVLFCDHIIYSPEGIYSYLQSGALKVIAKEVAKQINE